MKKKKKYNIYVFLTIVHLWIRFCFSVSTFHSIQTW